MGKDAVNRLNECTTITINVVGKYQATHSGLPTQRGQYDTMGMIIFCFVLMWSCNQPLVDSCDELLNCLYIYIYIFICVCVLFPSSIIDWSPGRWLGSCREWGQWFNSLPHLADIYNTSSDYVLQEPVSNYNDIMCESPDHNYKAILWQFPGPYI